MARKKASPVPASPDDTLDVSDIRDITDELPDELNAVEYVGPYQFPDNKRRRVPALMYLVVGVVLAVLWLAARSDASSLVNRGFGLGGLFLIALGLYGLKAATPMVVTDTCIGPARMEGARVASNVANSLLLRGESAEEARPRAGGRYQRVNSRRHGP
jgi:hypothetical protein